ncbi:MAG: hypothetical protein MPL62_01860 [Alphaproteobacteria bacterium]|nr:hypothetical protein [Alphaproteobacteria bacterium]
MTSLRRRANIQPRGQTGFSRRPPRACLTRCSLPATRAPRLQRAPVKNNCKVTNELRHH